MNANAFFDCVNAASVLTHCLSANDLSFLNSYIAPDADLSLPADQKGQNYYLLNSPYIYEKEDSYKGTFFLICFRITNGEQMLFGARLDIVFDQQCKIKTADYREMLSLVPESLPGPEAGVLSLSADDLKSLVGSDNRLSADDLKSIFGFDNRLTADDYISLQQIISKQIHEKLIADRRSFHMLYSPVYGGDSENSLMYGYSLKFKLNEKDDCYDMSLATVLYRFAKKEGTWCIDECRESASVPLCPLAANPNLPPQAKDMIARKFAKPLQADNFLDITPNDYAAVMDQAAQWVGAIRCCDPSSVISETLDTEADDLMVDVVVPASGMAGFTEQFAQMKRMRELQPKCQGVHTLSTPYVAAGEQNVVTAYFEDFGWTMMSGAFGNQGKLCPALPDVGRYIMKFRKRETGWKLFSLNWGPIIQYGMWLFDQESSIGWAHEDDNLPWPGVK